MNKGRYIFALIALSLILLAGCGKKPVGRLFYVLNDGDHKLLAKAKTVKDSVEVVKFDIEPHSYSSGYLPLEPVNIFVMDVSGANFRSTTYLFDYDPSKLVLEETVYFSGNEDVRYALAATGYLYEEKDRGMRDYEATKVATAQDLDIGHIYEPGEPIALTFDPVLPGEELKRELSVLSGQFALVPLPLQDMKLADQTAYIDKYLKAMPVSKY